MTTCITKGVIGVVCEYMITPTHTNTIYKQT